MGTDVHVLAVGCGRAIVRDARTRIEHLEALWSRFRPDSEISRVNGAHGCPVEVSPETIILADRSIEGRTATGGRFDPTVLGDLVTAGYDRSFELLDEQTRAVPALPRTAAAAIEIDHRACTISVADGAGFDPGGIGKGLAADLVVRQMIADGARGACVNIGGDLRAEGDAPENDGWIVAIEDPFGPQPIDLLRIASGAIATSARTKRTWRRGADRLHHLIDPHTGTSASTGIAAVTVIAGEGWWADVLAKAAFLAGDGACAVLESSGATGAVVRDDGEVLYANGLEDFIA